MSNSVNFHLIPASSQTPEIQSIYEICCKFQYSSISSARLISTLFCISAESKDYKGIDDVLGWAFDTNRLRRTYARTNTQQLNLIEILVQRQQIMETSILTASNMENDEHTGVSYGETTVAIVNRDVEVSELLVILSACFRQQSVPNSKLPRLEQPFKCILKISVLKAQQQKVKSKDDRLHQTNSFTHSTEIV